MSSTKQKIIESAIRLFNEYGVPNVRLQQIADESGISVGNLAYHFKNKEAIVLTVYEQVFDELSGILAQYLQDPRLVDFETQLEQFYNFFVQYRFFLIDLPDLEYSYPTVLEQWQLFMSKMSLQIRKRLDYFAQRKFIVPEPIPGLYETLTGNIWTTVVFWLPRQTLLGKPSDLYTFKGVIWDQIAPYLTPAGKLELHPG